MAIADQLDRLNVLRRNLAAALTAKNVETAETEGFETLVPKVAEIKVSVCVIKITFDSAFVGQSYTVTDGNGDAKTGIVPESCVDSVSVANCNTTYTISAAVGGVTYSTAVTTGAYFGQYTAALLISKIYGAQWDGTSTTAWTRTDDAALFTDPVPYVNGAASYGSPFDNIQPWAGMVKSERTGGTMVAIPKFWYKLTQSGNGMTIQIADKEVDGYSVSPAHMDRDDGKGERDVVYIGRYHCHTSNWKSQTGGQPKTDTTRSSARSSIHAIGSNIWQMDFAILFTIWLLYIVEFADWNSQAKIGYGCSPSGSKFNMGATDGMAYHTGTTAASRTSYGCCQYRNIEGLWDNVYDWLDGCYYNSSGLNIILNPNNFSESSGGVSVGAPSSGYPSKFSVKTMGGFPLFIPTAASGSDSTYSCDKWYFVPSDPCICAGSYYYQRTSCGLFLVNCSTTSESNEHIGCRLQELP